MKVNQTEIEIRYQETDQMGVVYHANYLVWFEIGRTKLMEQFGFKYAEMEKDNIISPVIDVHVQYKKPARYGQTIVVYTWLDNYDGIRTTYAYKVVNKAEEILVSGKTIHTIVNGTTFKPLRLKKVYPAWHEAYEKEVRGE